jgi:prepilin peptidase CpaA
MTLLPTLQLLVLAGLLTGAVAMDLKERRIPNKLTGPGLLAGLFLGALAEGGVPFAALSGAGLGLAVCLPFVVLGGIGGGDAKLLMAVGTFVGPGGLLSVVLYGALAGGILALGNAVRRGAIIPVLLNSGRLFVYLITLGRHGERFGLDSPQAHAVPYGLAIAAGALATWFYPFSLGGSL